MADEGGSNQGIILAVVAVLITLALFVVNSSKPEAKATPASSSREMYVL